jgi:sugar/nucleoside kinase (ribokinase family)
MELKPQFDIVIPGHYFCDLIFTGIPAFPALGTEVYCENIAVVPGGIMNTVIALHRLEVNIGWIGMVGDDFFSRYILECAETEGLNTSLLIRRDSPVRRVTVSLSYPEDRAFVTYVDPTPDRTDLALEALERVDFRHLHFTGLEVDERIPGLLHECRQRGISVSMDCQHREETLAEPLVREIISGLDLFMPNHVEAQRVTGTDNLNDAIEALRGLGPTIVLKNGAKGASAIRNYEFFEEAAISVNPVDTTGAGDAFNAGFLAAYLDQQPIANCLRWGNFTGGMSTLGTGGATTAPTRAALQAWLATA